MGNMWTSGARRGCLLSISLAAVTSVVPGHALYAQTATGEITVTVQDASGAVIPKAQVEVRGSDTGAIVRQLVSNDSGIADLPLLQSGRYNIHISAPGFTSLDRNGIDLQVGSVVNLTLKLSAGDAGQTVTVTGDAPLVETAASAVAQVIDNNQMEELPLNGRSYLSTALLIPGATPSMNSRDGSFSAYGNSGLQNAFLLDGVRNVNYMRGLDSGSRDAVRPPLDAVQEFSVQSSNFSAEFGASAGAVVNAVTRSGTNHIHGSAFDFMRNSAMDAVSYFATSGTVRKPLLVQNQYGGSLGGPILRNRLFLFGAYEGLHSHTDSLSTSQVPTDAMRSGDFTGQKTIYDPLTTVGTGTTATRTAFANNKIPTSRINTTLQALINEYPEPNDAADGPTYYKRLVPALTDNKNGVVRGDYQISATNSVFGRYSQTQSLSSSEAALPPPVQDPSRSYVNSRGIGAGWTKVLGSNKVNEARFGYSFIGIDQHGINARNEVVPGSLDPSVGTGMPTFSITNFAQVGAESASNGPLTKTSGTWVASDNFSLSHGRHVFKVGGEFLWINASTFATGNGRSAFGFTGVFTQAPSTRSTTGVALADYLMGYANSLTTGTITNSNEREWSANGYFADQWTVSPNLSLNLGIRYEFTTPSVETANNQANFILDKSSPLYLQYVFAGDSRLPRALIYGDYTNVAPRIGFAYKVPGTSDMSIRSSFGLFYAQDQGQGAKYRLVANPPFYGYGSQTITSDQLNVTSGFVINDSASIARPTPVPASSFTLDPTSTTQLTSFSTNLRTPYVQQWSLSVQKQLVWGTLLEVNYVGNHAVHLHGQGEGNQPTTLASTTVASRRPLKAVTDAPIRTESDWNFSNYNGLSAKVEKRMRHGVSFLNSFTYGHNLDLQNPSGDLGSTGVASDTIQDNYNVRANYGNSDQDIRFRYALSGTLQFPFGRGRAFLNRGVGSALAGGWSVSPVYVYQTGAHFTAALSSDTANAGTITRPNQLCSGNLSSGRSIKKWFDTSCYVQPTSYTFGNASKNTLVAPPTNNLNLTLQRQFAPEWFHSAALNLRVEGYNLLNHPQFSTPGATVGTTTYGVISSAASQRQLQIAARVVF